MLPQANLKKPVVAVRRAARILRYLSRTGTPVGVNRIARDLEIIPSTCLHILRTLTQESLVAFNSATKQYLLGHAVLGLARDSLASSTFVQEARPLLNDLAERHGVTVTAAELDANDHMVVVVLSTLGWMALSPFLFGGLTTNGTLYSLIGGYVVAIIVARIVWRCPFCNTWLGKGWSKRFCHNCGKSFEESVE